MVAAWVTCPMVVVAKEWAASQDTAKAISNRAMVAKDSSREPTSTSMLTRNKANPANHSRAHRRDSDSPMDQALGHTWAGTLPEAPFNSTERDKNGVGMIAKVDNENEVNDELALF